ncbi:MAG: phosphoglycerate kinase [Candidatus Kapaibacterium sp.]|jgi:phosphoglycerate kinase
MIRTLDELPLRGHRVLVRVDYNVPFNDAGAITDDTRIVESLPTVRKICAEGGIAVLMSHLGRPKGKVNPKYSLAPVAQHLSGLLQTPVHFVPVCIGAEAEAAVAAAQPGQIVMLENVRFHPEEEANDPVFAEQLSRLGDVYVNDAFGTAHRAHASTEGVATFFATKRGAGYLIAKELQYLGSALSNPARPFVAILGGSKVSDKIEVIQNLLSKADSIIIGGGMANTFVRAQGLPTGDSLVEEDKLEMARALLQSAGDRILLPTDAIIADAFDANANHKAVSVQNIPEGWRILDIGPESVKSFTACIESAKTVVWNGPMGVFEFPAFSGGTFGIAHALCTATAHGAVTIVGGGDSAAAIAQAGLKSGVSHVSTGGGASLEYLEGKVLPGIAILEE